MTLETPSTVLKDWCGEPIPVREKWRTCYAASGPRYYKRGQETLDKAIRGAQRGHPTDPVLSVAKYETRVVGEKNHGVYFDHYVAHLDEEDHDITRNLQTLC